MASPFSGVLQLTDLDDFIGPSQVGRPRASAQEEGPGLAVRSGKPLPLVSFPEHENRPRAQGPGPRASVSLVPFLPTQTTEAWEGWAASYWTPRCPGGISRSYGSI